MLSSRISRSWVAAAFTIAFVASGGITSAATAADPIGTAPTFTDGCEGNDFVRIPDYSYNSWFIDGVQYVQGGTYPAPSTAVTVTSTGDYVGSWPYQFVNTAACATPATNAFGATVGQCNTATKETPVFGVVTNTADGTFQPIDAYVKATRPVDDYETSTFAGLGIQDGETRSIPLLGSRNVGLLPGDYELTFYSAPGFVGYLGRAPVSVGTCGGLTAPVDETGGGSNDRVKPTGSLRQVSGTTKMVAQGNNSKVDRTTKFKVIINPVKGKTFTKSFTVRKNKLGKPKTYRAPVRTRFVLKALITSESPDGKITTNWKVLKRSLIRPGGS